MGKNEELMYPSDLSYKSIPNYGQIDGIVCHFLYQDLT